MKTSKKLTSKNGITIPKQIRTEIGFTPGMAVDVESSGNGVKINPHVPVCRFCGSSEAVMNICGINICEKCAAALQKELNKKYGS
jgi:transcriptional pleiotropic regulator of transition state genes